jgi:hexosaminidase
MVFYMQFSTHAFPDSVGIIPEPLRVERGSGEFVLQSSMRITFEGAEAGEIAQLLAEYLRPATGFAFPVEASPGPVSGGIHLHCPANAPSDAAGFQNEKYSIIAGNEGVSLGAESASGLARAIQTFRQLLPPQIFSSQVAELPWVVPHVRIEDAPRFRWRGLLLDVARHFFPVEEVCRFIDLLALHRFNVCHLHLTDDQGWRVEIKKYPRLTEVGSIRRQTLIGFEGDRPKRYDGTPYGGFYTQEDLRKIVEFAAKRKVMVVPEIEMPGHVQAAVAAYPELGCTGHAPEVRCHWGISQHIYNVEESTIAFCRDVLDEVMDIFPSRFIHVGGDEAPKHEWTQSERIQQRMAELGLKSENELQSWFIREMVTHIESKGRRLLGWDEILEGGLPEGSTVMSWRGEEGGIAAAREGHDVVMSPNTYVYFDYYQAEPVYDEPVSIFGPLTIGHAYSYEPLPEKLPANQHHHILGVQGALWTEYIETAEHLYYMAYPRTCALAEVVWLPKDRKNFKRFLNDLRHHRSRLENYGIHPHPQP